MLSQDDCGCAAEITCLHPLSLAMVELHLDYHPYPSRLKYHLRLLLDCRFVEGLFYFA